MTEQERQAFIRALSFEGEIEDFDGVLNFAVKKDFDLAVAFEGFYDPAIDPPICHIDITYRIRDKLVWYSLELEFGLSRDTINNMHRIFPLSDEERECMRDKMNDYCFQQAGVSLLEYGILHWSEDDGPRPRLARTDASAQLERREPQPISGIDFMEWFAAQCIDQMVQDMQSKATPEEWEKIVAGESQG